ncbi:hypothetical protein GCM10022268_07620 [Sphingomonas cynarae]|uniref:Uncharacterized protein n=1 Tax=Sphingomonas cynarae TaxID=930197 RepID=A0ABP7D2J4_9SPHN
MPFIARRERVSIGLGPIMLAWLSTVALPAASHGQVRVTRTDGDQLVSRIVECHDIVPSDKRLECYDRQVTALAEAQQSRSVVVLSRSDIAEKKREAFGLQASAVAGLDRQDPAAIEVTELDSAVRRIAASGRDRLAIYLADGSVWQTLERVRLTPNTGDNIHIRRAALGSFIGSYKGGSIRLKRLR